ncbi:MAG: transposase [Planctomycetia bacterium]|nr:transposase [Planctomycetia bacterium]
MCILLQSNIFLLEGINNKIQSLIKKTYGYRNTDRFKNAVLFHCGGLNLYPEIYQ